MLGIGFSEIVIIALVCFIAIGPKQLPTVLRKIAQFYRQFLTLKDELSFQILSAHDDEQTRKPRTPDSPLQAADKEIVAVPRENNNG